MIKESYYQKDAIKWIDNIESGVMISVYGHKKMLGSDIFIRSYLIPANQAEKELEAEEPRHEKLTPGFIQYGSGENSEVVYYRFGNDNGTEPLIIEIEYNGIQDDCIELNEEFRQLFSLYFNKSKNEYVCLQDDDRIVCKLDVNYTTVDKKYLKSFLAAKNMVLVICVDGQIQETIGDKKYENISIPVKQKNTIGSVNIGNYNGKNYSQLYAKKIVDGCPLNSCNLWPFIEKHEYIEFIIGTDENGNEVIHSCNPDTLSDYYGSKPGAPHYLTPVYFDRTVLERYIKQPDRYSVEPGILRCGTLWAIYIDNESSDYVSAYLGDLGRDLPSVEEQRYWRSFNKVLEGHLSKAKVDRDFKSVWSKSESPEFIFKSKYQKLFENSERLLGWSFLLALSEEDAHNFTALRIPLRESQEEFDGLVLSLVKVLIDSLNEKEILRHIHDRNDLSGGISKLERWFKEVGIQNYDEQIKFLRNLQDLRSKGTGHRKGEGYEKIRVVFGLEDNNFKKVFGQILINATVFLDFIDENLNNLKGEV